MTKNIRKIWNAFTTVSVILVIALALLLAGVRIFGLQVYTVLSGSMEPAYQTGSLIYVRPVEPAVITVGEPITFVLNESLTVATHRVIGIDAQSQRFYTKGDANDTADGAPVHFKNLIGTPIYTIPYLGYIANYIQHPPGLYFALAGALILLLLVFLPDLLDDGNKKENKPARRG